MKFMFLIYHDEKTLDSLPDGEMQRLVDSALGYMEELRQSGHFIVSNALQRGRTARTIRVRGGKATTTDGPFAETKEQLGGFFLARRGQGHRRGVRAGLAIPTGPYRDHRGAPGPGAAALLAAARSGYVIGVMEGWMLLADVYQVLRLRGTPTPGSIARLVNVAQCARDRKMVYSQMVAIVVKYMEANPAQWHESMAALVWAAMDRACEDPK
jgi:hypothetical protein